MDDFDDENQDLNEDEESEDLEDEEAEEQAEIEEQNKAQERVLKNKLKKINQNLTGRQLPLYTPTEKSTLQKAEKNKNLTNDVNQVKLKMAAKRVQFASKSISAIAPAIPYLLIAALIILAFIAFVALMATLFPWLFPGGEGSDPSKGATSQFGVSGKDFYGVRTIYRDNEKSRGSMLEQYVDVLQDGITQATSITTISTGGETYATSVVVNISLPSVDFNYSTFEETQFASDFAVVYNFVKESAALVYTADTTLTAPETLTEIFDATTYFGINQAVIVDIQTKVSDLVLSNYQITATSGGTTVEDATTISNINTEFSTQFSSKLDAYFAAFGSTRAEKVFIKDFLFENDDDRMKNILKEEYVAAIFMPKNNVTLTSSSVYVTDADFTSFEMKLDGTAYQKDADNLKINADDPDMYLFQTGSISISATTFENIDLENKNKLSSGVSLAELIKLGKENQIDSSKYLTEKTDENGVVYSTWKDDGTKIEFTTNQKFIFVEFETKVS